MLPPRLSRSKADKALTDEIPEAATLASAEARDEAIRALSDKAAMRNLGLLINLRWIALAGQLATIAGATLLLGAKLPLGLMLAVMLGSALINVYALWRQRHGQHGNSWTMTFELLMDVVALTMLLYFSGGASNPFVTLFILQVLLGLVLIPMPRVLVILGATILANYWLLRHGTPLELDTTLAHADDFMTLHLQGMFISFVLATGLLTWLLRGIQNNLAHRDAQITALRQKITEDEHFVRLGVMASSTAHELGTPLTTLAVTLDDWVDVGLPDAEEAARVLPKLQTELGNCRSIVSDMLFATGLDRFEAAERVSLGDFLDETIEAWGEDGGALAITLPERGNADLPVLVDSMLEQALRNLFNNAQQAGATRMEITARCDPDGSVHMTLTDNGPGFPADVLADPIRPVKAERGNPGRGFGLYLVTNAMRRLGGAFEISNVPGGGARIDLMLPPQTTASAAVATKTME